MTALLTSSSTLAPDDATWGWLRCPGCLPSQMYLTTHPRLYARYVGLYARLRLKSLGDVALSQHEEAEVVRQCLELRMQVYNAKIALPSAQTRRFSHVDCDWKLAGCNAAPAPQCMVATSPSDVQGTRDGCVYGCRFIDAEAAVNAYHSDVSSGSHSHKKPYEMPRPANANVAKTHASPPPPSCRDFSGSTASGPHKIQPGEVLFFGHLTAHEFTQYATLPRASQPPETVPLAWTRTAEYPTLVCPAMHGKPMQSKSEVLAW